MIFAIALFPKPSPAGYGWLNTKLARGTAPEDFLSGGHHPEAQGRGLLAWA